MLFNSFEFLLVFLPLTLAGFVLLARVNRALVPAWLSVASLAFYAWWDTRYLWLLAGSIAFNYLAGARIASATGTLRRVRLGIAIAIDLALLGYFKYANFFVDTVNATTAAGWPSPGIVLPIGISFFTFTQIAFLVDTFHGKVREYRWINYVLFVTYFPHLIAGPVLHHGEMMPQFAKDSTYRPKVSNFVVGTTIFAIGLAKKVLIADHLAPHANALFDHPGDASLLVAWGGVLAYTFQLYFDFSGYSDMAIGLSRLFGVKLPLNFASPYKAANISEFWRRWHMTLSRFLRDYLYVPLGGNRKGRLRRYVNLLATMLLGGLWHGAGWNFVIWGGLHGAYLCIHQMWSSLTGGTTGQGRSRTARVTGVALTFVAVCVAWVFFRAPDLATARTILGGLAGASGVGLPAAFASHLGPLAPWLERVGVDFFLGGGARFVQTWAWVVPAALIAFGMPNTQELLARTRPALGARPERARGLRWRPDWRWATFAGLLLALGILSLEQPSDFLYFQF